MATDSILARHGGAQGGDSPLLAPALFFALRRTRAVGTRRLVLAGMLSLANHYREVHASMPVIAEQSGHLSLDTVRVCIADLRTWGEVVQVQRGRGRKASVYRILVGEPTAA